MHLFWVPCAELFCGAVGPQPAHWGRCSWGVFLREVSPFNALFPNSFCQQVVSL